MDHQRGRIITHGGHNTSNLDLIKQEHCGDAVGELGQRGIKLCKQNRFWHIFPSIPAENVGASTHHQKQETLSVIVQPHEDSRDSTQMLSPGKLTPCSEIIDTSDFRAINEPTYQTLTSVNGRMSPPGFSPNSSYATLTPLQPLPPISTMSDKFAYGHGHGECCVIFV